MALQGNKLKWQNEGLTKSIKSPFKGYVKTPTQFMLGQERKRHPISSFSLSLLNRLLLLIHTGSNPVRGSIIKFLKKKE
mgnify:CR=1 FL=1